MIRRLAFVAAISMTGIIPVVQAAASTPSAVNEKYVGNVKLPMSYNAAPDGYPIGLYWALHNQLSKYVGLDLTSQLGHELKIYFEGHDVILKDFQGHVVGKWRSTGRDLSDATTTGKSFQTVTGMSLNRWIETHQPVVPSKRLKMSPEEAIRLFYSANNSHDEALAMSYVDPALKYQWMFLIQIRMGCTSLHGSNQTSLVRIYGSRYSKSWRS